LVFPRPGADNVAPGKNRVIAFSVMPSSVTPFTRCPWSNVARSRSQQAPFDKTACRMSQDTINTSDVCLFTRRPHPHGRVSELAKLYLSLARQTARHAGSQASFPLNKKPVAPAFSEHSIERSPYRRGTLCSNAD
jgi:hypothetical protein